MQLRPTFWQWNPLFTHSIRSFGSVQAVIWASQLDKPIRFVPFHSRIAFWNSKNDAQYSPESLSTASPEFLVWPSVQYYDSIVWSTVCPWDRGRRTLNLTNATPLMVVPMARPALVSRVLLILLCGEISSLVISRIHELHFLRRCWDMRKAEIHVEWLAGWQSNQEEPLCHYWAAKKMSGTQYRRRPRTCFHGTPEGLERRIISDGLDETTKKSRESV